MLYGMSLYVLAKIIQGEYPVFIQLWYADDFSTSGAGSHIKPVIYYIDSLGPSHSFFLGTENSQFVWGPGVSKEVKRVYKDPFEYSHWEGKRQIDFLLGIMRPNRYGWSRR